MSDVFKDEVGHIIEGEPDEVLYDTFYRFLVLVGIPDASSQVGGTKVWSAVTETLEGPRGKGKKGKSGKRKTPTDTNKFNRDRRKYSLSHGNNKYIARARRALEVCFSDCESLAFLE